MQDTRLLIVGTQGPGGIGQYIREQRRHLAGELSVSTHSIGGFATDGPLSFIKSVLVIVWNALTFVVRSPPDIVHVHSSHRFSFYRAGFYVLFASRVWNCPVVLHIHGSSFDTFVSTKSTLVRRYQSLVYDAADEIIVLSAYWKNILGTHTGETKLTVIPNAADTDDFAPAFEGEVPHIAFVSNMIERKGILELTEAVDELARSGCEFRLSLAGKGPRAGAAEALAAKHAHVEYLGYVSEEKKQELLGEASIFVLPSYAEGLPIAILEAMAAGNAIISTTVGSIPEVIGEERGLLVEPGNASQLADVLRELIADPERVAKMGEASREAVIAQYSWSMVTDELLSTYERHLDITRP
ncbi:MAG TPA: glycosyltransferase family 4 protein [Halococcus sp.]|nr:glycosyltransferase family 4 protein [Halococcus sp.]